jgi:hypothetical protein
VRISDQNKSGFKDVETKKYDANQHNAKYWGLLPVLAVLCCSMKFSPFSHTHFCTKSFAVKGGNELNLTYFYMQITFDSVVLVAMCNTCQKS